MEDQLDPAARYDHALIHTMTSREGRRFVWGVLSKTSLMQTPFHPEPTTMAYNVGKGDVGRELFADIQRVVPDLYLTMMKEAKEDNDHDDERRNSTRSDDDLDSIAD